MVPVGWGYTLCPPQQKGGEDEEPRWLGSAGALPRSPWEQLRSGGETGWVFLLVLQMGEFPVAGEAEEAGDAP